MGWRVAVKGDRCASNQTRLDGLGCGLAGSIPNQHKTKCGTPHLGSQRWQEDQKFKANLEERDPVLKTTITNNSQKQEAGGVTYWFSV